MKENALTNTDYKSVNLKTIKICYIVNNEYSYQ